MKKELETIRTSIKEVKEKNSDLDCLHFYESLSDEIDQEILKLQEEVKDRLSKVF